MNVKAIIPTPVEIGRETLIIIGGVICAALLLSRFPGLKTWIADQGAIVLKDSDGRVLW